MFRTLWDTFLYEPLYNALIFLIGVVPGGEVGIAVIILTILVKFVLLPLSQKSVAAQSKMRSLEGEIGSIKEKYKNDREAQARETMALYKKHDINPFSGCVTLLIQLPIIFALYFVFLKGLSPTGGVLYSFVHYPAELNMHFLGFIDLSQKNIFLALIAAACQYLQMHLSVPRVKERTGGEVSFADEFSRSMNTQMRYIFPVLVAFIAYTTSAVVALYWSVSSLFSVGQELWTRRSVSIKKDI